ncbi:kinase-like domain-containing protein [Podospora didyma]|uniref:Kinase-like domain-containing protein n=1 Tax=Podospora didyma TaxID=330526 RepID=A0AAE0U5B6_9PEZI|nr:kinase-like domain-containing protein [Podospora didyma]
MPADLVLAGLATAKSGAEILVYIIRKAQDVRRLKKECEKVGELAQLLQSVLDSNEEALKSSSTEKKLQAHLRDVATFVTNCTKDYSLLGRAWEVMWDKKLPKLLAGLKDWILYFLMDAMSRGITVGEKLVDGQERIISRLTIVDDINSHLSSLDEGLRGQEKVFSAIMDEKLQILSKTSAKWRADFQSNDTRLKASQDSSGDLSGTLDGQRVVLYPISSNQRDSRVGPRHVTLYSKLSANTSVHSFYGLADRNGQLYAVMQDLRTAKSLGSCLADPQFSDARDRLRVAYDVAQTMAYLHSVEILVRSLSDQNVVLTREDREWKPVLTRLDQARLFLEDTSSAEVDIRYEAPEYRLSQRHSPETDTWSFGVLLWEWVEQKFPFGLAEPVLVDAADRQPQPADGADTPERQADSVHRALDRRDLPWLREDTSVAPPILALIRGCCHLAPAIRPSMAFVARSLWLLLSGGSVLIVTPEQDREETKSRVHSILELAEKKAGDQHQTLRVQMQDAEVLRSLADDGDPVASALLGAAIWMDLTDYGVDGDGDSISLNPTDISLGRSAAGAAT